MAREAIKNMFSMYRKVIAVFIILFALPCVATFFGYGIIAWAIFVLIFAVLYSIAPRRKYPTAENISDDVDMDGKVVLITGPTSGIGEETARVLARRGAHVVLASRSAKKLEETKMNIQCSNPLSKSFLTCLECQLDDLESVRKCAEEFLAMKLPLHVLICNAGIMAVPERTATAQGLEQQVGCNHIGHFYLIQLLLPAMEKARGSRLVMLSSAGHALYDSAFLKTPKLETTPYDKWVAYGNSKVSSCLIAKEFNTRYRSKAITAYSVNPGGIHTGLQGNVDRSIALAWLLMTPFVFKTIPQGAATTVLCATKANLEEYGGKYFNDCQPTDVADKVANKITKDIGADASKTLWDATEQVLIDLKYMKSKSWW